MDPQPSPHTGKLHLSWCWFVPLFWINWKLLYFHFHLINPQSTLPWRKIFGKSEISLFSLGLGYKELYFFWKGGFGLWKYRKLEVTRIVENCRNLLVCPAKSWNFRLIPNVGIGLCWTAEGRAPKLGHWCGAGCATCKEMSEKSHIGNASCPGNRNREKLKQAKKTVARRTLASASVRMNSSLPGLAASKPAQAEEKITRVFFFFFDSPARKRHVCWCS